jgi:3-hydroxyacyl-[acyl-carrier protein] dehydratase/trans-2-decenoyl-[acyl-carrier protein] isomerase
MTHSEFMQRVSFNKQELIACANGTLLDDGPTEMGRLPSPPMLMFDRIVEVNHDGNRGRIVAEQDVALDAWYFWCHFRHDPVQPGCLGLDAIWQLMGFYLALRGVSGTGRALGCKEVLFTGQIRPHNIRVRYEVNVTRVNKFNQTGAALAIGDGAVLVDGECIYSVREAKVGTFMGIQYADYPLPSRNSLGGIAAPAPTREVAAK